VNRVILMKNLIIFSILILTFAINLVMNVEAKTIELRNIDFSNTVLLLDSESNCDFLLGAVDNPNDVAYWLDKALDIMKYIAIVAVLVLSTIDFIKAVVSEDNEALQKAALTSGKRFIFAVIIFFLPIIVGVIMDLLGVYGTCGIS